MLPAVDKMKNEVYNDILKKVFLEDILNVR